MDQMTFRGSRPEIYLTDLTEPFEGRIFVWAWDEWFERIEGESGNVAFTPIAYTQQELLDQLAQEGISELIDADDDTENIVLDEFLDQNPLYPEPSEVADEDPYMSEEFISAIDEEGPPIDEEHW